MGDPKTIKQTAFWESMLNKYQQRNTRLQQQQCQIQHHLEALECAIPATIARNKDNGGNQANMPKFMSQIGKINITKSTTSSIYIECPCGSCMAKRNSTQVSQQSSADTASSCASCPCDPCKSNQQSNVSADDGCPCNPCVDNKQSSIRSGTSSASCPCNPCMDTPQSESCSCTPCLGNISLFSLQPADLDYIKKLAELSEREKQMKTQIEELLQREQAYVEMLQQADDMWACMEKCYKQHLCDVQQSGDNERFKYEKLSEKLKEENIRLNDELKDVKLELKQCMERLQGPISRELDKERRRSQQLENELEYASQKIATKENSYLKEMNDMQKQLNCTCKNLCELNSANEELRKEMRVLQCKYNELQGELIKQKISEGLTLQKMQEMWTMGKTKNEGEPEKKTAPQKPESEGAPAITIKFSETRTDATLCIECNEVPKTSKSAEVCGCT
ncbi:hypothetical protein ILUMI_22663 [Ignelater luminosus]|uniref:Uncharacterized protein n=1 Tax=Ignelater luminosus TaxID=2038154 RepID=A0A8K0C9M9_IGNLU|nr:hypothetical protein ILUMI_22663 [Ignelater luminosus]